MSFPTPWAGLPALSALPINNERDGLRHWTECTQSSCIMAVHNWRPDVPVTNAERDALDATPPHKPKTATTVRERDACLLARYGWAGLRTGSYARLYDLLAAGGVGHLLVGWLKAIGATVIGTVSTDEKAAQAKAAGALTIAVVTLPFASEGKVRMQNALEGLNKLRKHADTVIVIPNDKLLSIVPDLPLNTAFKVSDEVLAGAVKGLAELVTKAGLVNLDFADLRTILSSAGCAVVGIGEASVEAKPDQRALIAVDTAMNSPLLDVDISTANRALINVVGGEDMTLREAELIVSEVSKRIDPSSHIIWGARVEKNAKKSSVRVLAVLAGAKFPQYELTSAAMNAGARVEDAELDLDLLG